MYTALVLYISVMMILASFAAPRKGVKFLSWTSFAAIAVLIAFRGADVGADTENYHRMYGLIGSSIIEIGGIEIGYVWLVKLLNIISSDPQALFIVQGILVGVSCHYFITRNTSRVCEAYIAILAFLAFNLFSFHLSGVRQSLAMCVCLFAYEQIKQKNLVMFLLLVGIACLFHMSAMFFVPAYFIANLQKGKARFWAIVGTIAGTAMMQQAMAVFSMANDRFAKYGVEETDSGYIFFAVVTLVTLFDLIYQVRISKKTSLEGLHSNLNCVTAGMWVMRLFTRVIERISYFYLPATMVVLAHTHGAFRNEGNRKLYVISLATLLIILFLYRMKAWDYSFC